ncbi:MAG: tetratricopeptide repeat protein [Verrucomicrobiota bacterium]|jgi:TolA-binding protein
MEADSLQSTERHLKILAWLHANQKKLIIGGCVVAVIVLAAVFMAWQKTEAESSANARLLNVPLETFHGSQMTPTPAGPFLDLAKQSPDTEAGEYAAMLGAKALFTEGKYPEAHQEFSKFIEQYPDSPLIPQARVGLAACLEGEGKTLEAAQKYQEILSVYASDANITTPAKLTVARLDEALNKPEQALAFYEELARVNNPYDPWAAEARERGEFLLLKHPELRKAPPASATSSSAPLNLGPSPKATKTPGTANP